MRNSQQRCLIIGLILLIGTSSGCGISRAYTDRGDRRLPAPYAATKEACKLPGEMFGSPGAAIESTAIYAGAFGMLILAAYLDDDDDDDHEEPSYEYAHHAHGHDDDDDDDFSDDLAGGALKIITIPLWVGIDIVSAVVVDTLLLPLTWPYDAKYAKEHPHAKEKKKQASKIQQVNGTGSRSGSASSSPIPRTPFTPLTPFVPPQPELAPKVRYFGDDLGSRRRLTPPPKDHAVSNFQQ